jgi:hypothetical protein
MGASAPSTLPRRLELTREIPLTRGYVALVDDGDYDLLVSMGKWQARVTKHTVYAEHSPRINGRQVTTGMHRIIMGLEYGDRLREVDHGDHNGLNNQKSNLSIKTKSENQRNRKSGNTNNTSGILGVVWHKGNRKWQAQIGIGAKATRKTISLGYFDKIEDAAAARASAALKYGFTR